VTGAQSAVIVRAPDPDGLVQRWRLLHTADGPRGMPAHITVLFPFVDSELLVPAVDAELSAAVRGLPRFEFELRSIARFDGPPYVLYAAPAPAGPFSALTGAVAGRFGLRPYGGAHDDVVAHCTIGVANDPAVLEPIEAAIAPSLPIRGVADRVEVWRDTPRGWQFDRAVALGG